MLPCKAKGLEASRTRIPSPRHSQQGRCIGGAVTGSPRIMVAAAAQIIVGAGPAGASFGGAPPHVVQAIGRSKRLTDRLLHYQEPAVGAPIGGWGTLPVASTPCALILFRPPRECRSPSRGATPPKGRPPQATLNVNTSAEAPPRSRPPDPIPRPK